MQRDAAEPEPVLSARFPGMRPEIASCLGRFLDYEKHAGLAMREGDRGLYLHYRELARTAWAKYLSLGGKDCRLA